ncbi:MAG: ATP-binding protein [Chloroflexota bacterium]|nr:MAG: ATP-binding protein [Chloroflexota bacterium]
MSVVMVTETFPGRFESLAVIRKFVFQAASDAGFDEKDIYAVELAVDEACANIIEHAYGGEDVGEIECTCNDLIDGLEIIIKDDGEPFDPSTVVPPDFSVELEDVKPRGAGLFLIRNMMDDVDFVFSKKDGNILRMVKRKKE